jgi:hypothetical protein
MKNKTLLITLGLIAGGVLFINPAIAQDLDSLARGHVTKQAGGFMYMMKMFAMIFGVLAMIGSLLAMVLLAMEKAPQQIQQVGYKGPIIGLIVGGLLCSITWLVGFSSQTATGTQYDQDTWNRLNQSGSVIELDSSALYATNFVIRNTVA